MDRSTFQSVKFLHPFRLRGIEGMFAPGAYDVETIEEQLEGLSFAAFRRVSTTIILVDPATGARQVTEIDPEDLATALKTDAEACEGHPKV